MEEENLRMADVFARLADPLESTTNRKPTWFRFSEMLDDLKRNLLQIPESASLPGPVQVNP